MPSIASSKVTMTTILSQRRENGTLETRLSKNERNNRFHPLAGPGKKNMPPTERSFYLLNTRTICVIFLYNCMQCFDGFIILLERYVTKGNDAKNPAIFSFCMLPKEPS